MSAQRRPFFAFLNYYDAQRPISSRDGGRRFDLRSTSPFENVTLRDWEGDPSRQHSAQSIKLARGCYDDCITYLDDQIGRLFDDLGTRGLLENTVVLITSDHGEQFGEHGGICGHRLSLYGQEIRVPLLVIAPARVPSGQIVSAPVSLRDLPATVMDLAELGPESNFPGSSLARFWKPGGAGDLVSADPVFAESDHAWPPAEDGGRLLQSLSIGEMVYIRNSAKKEELYNIAADPAQAQNLAESADAHASLELLRTALDRFLAGNTGPGTPARSVAQGSLAPATPNTSPDPDA